MESGYSPASAEAEAMIKEQEEKRLYNPWYRVNGREKK
jgi:hypothetical protein